MIGERPSIASKPLMVPWWPGSGFGVFVFQDVVYQSVVFAA